MKPFIQHSDTCPCPPCTQHREQHPKPHMSWRPILVSLCLVVPLMLAGLVWAHSAEAREGIEHPVPIPAGLLRERGECRNTQHTETCLRGKLRVAYAGLEWARNARQHAEAPYGVQHALRLASALYGIPLSEMRAVGDCESHLNPLAKNRTSTATGVFQWLDGSWRTQGLPGFARTDPYASALAAARAVQRDHGWSQWVCKP